VTTRDIALGIAKEYLQKTHDPFFTTKEQVTGTFLGLDIVRALLVKEGEKINVFSQEGNGATFSLTFPTSQLASTRWAELNKLIKAIASWS
jgi:signal transduction histidine kinase